MAESILIEEQCSLIKDFDKSLTNDQVASCLDTIVVELNEIKSLTTVATIQQIVTAISLRSTHDRAFFTAKFFDHQLFIIIRNYYLTLIRQ